MDRTTIHSAQLSTRNRRFHRRPFPGARNIPKVPAMASVPAGTHGGLDGPKGRSSIAVAAVVVTVKVLDTAAPPDGVTLAGENAHAAIPGNAPQENFTVPE